MTRLTGIKMSENKLTGIIMSENKLTGCLGARNEINVDIIGTGARGKEGKSAYETWLEQGNEGTEQEYLASLKGEQGIQGIKGDKGDTGDLSNLDVAPVAFTENSTLSNINTGETVATLFGKLKKLFTDTLAHFTDNVKHITSAERSSWNGKANATDLTSHTGDNVKHITASERTTWNAKLDSFTETDPTVPSWAKTTNKPAYTKAEVGLGNVDNIRQYSASNLPPYPVTSVNAKTGEVTLTASDVGAFRRHDYASYLEFPTTPTHGTENDFFIDVGANATYRWDSANLHYYCIGRDYEEIDIISGGSV